MNFYKDIAHSLYIQNTKIGNTHFSNPFDFIEAKHNEAPYKGKVFYQNLIHAMPTGERLADTEKGETPTIREKIFYETLNYCKQKIDMLEQPYDQPDFFYSITGAPAWIAWENDKGHGAKLNAKGKGKAHALDIQNFATIAIDGGIKHPEQNFYDNTFIKAINATKNKAETIRYINHHYSNAKNKNVFLRKIDSLFDRIKKFPIDEVLTQDIRSVLIEWYNSERSTLSDTQEIDNVQEYGNTDSNESENNIIRTTIDEYLEPFKDKFRNEEDYNKAIDYLMLYFEDKEPEIIKPIFVQRNTKTKLALELGKLNLNLTSDSINKKYLSFLIKLFTVFNKEKLDKPKITQTNLYKYCTTKKKI